MRSGLDSFPVAAPLPVLAAALEGDPAALAAARQLAAETVCAQHRLGAILARLAAAGGHQEGPGWRAARRTAAANLLLGEATLEAVGKTLGAAGLQWAPFKGADLAQRVYPEPEDRPAADLDVLIAAEDFTTARAALEAAGWQALTSGPRAERYRREEGYCWQAQRPGATLLELHFRLWGLLPAGCAAALLADAAADPALPAGGRRLSLAAAYTLAAVHQWMTPPPRPLLGWWDLRRIGAAADEGLAAAIITLAITWDLTLPVGLAAAVVARLWDDAPERAVATALTARLQPAEQRVLRRLARHGEGGVSFSSLALARLLAGRRSRGGWRVVPRRLWAHPGVVEQQTPATWPWALRRLWHLATTLPPLRTRAARHQGQRPEVRS